MAVHLMQVSGLAQQAGFEWAEVVPVSAMTGAQLDVLVDVLVPLLPKGEAFFAQGQSTDEPEIIRIAELIREASLEGVRDELPHSIAVLVDEVTPREDRPQERPLTDVSATLFVERTSQKAIVIGRGGQRLREVGEKARHEIEALLGTPVYLDLRIKVAKDWQRDPKQLRRVGF
jgi:GTP-binding protein Era